MWFCSLACAQQGAVTPAALKRRDLAQTLRGKDKTLEKAFFSDVEARPRAVIWLPATLAPRHAPSRLRGRRCHSLVCFARRAFATCVAEPSRPHAPDPNGRRRALTRCGHSALPTASGAQPARPAPLRCRTQRRSCDAARLCCAAAGCRRRRLGGLHLHRAARGAARVTRQLAHARHALAFRHRRSGRRGRRHAHAPVDQLDDVGRARRQRTVRCGPSHKPIGCAAKAVRCGIGVVAVGGLRTEGLAQAHCARRRRLQHKVESGAAAARRRSRARSSRRVFPRISGPLPIQILTAPPPP